MKKLSIEEQKKFLFKRLKTEPLRKTNENQKISRLLSKLQKARKFPII